MLRSGNLNGAVIAVIEGIRPFAGEVGPIDSDYQKNAGRAALLMGAMVGGLILLNAASKQRSRRSRA